MEREDAIAWFEARRRRLVAGPSARCEFIPAPVAVAAGGGDYVLHLRQTYRGLEVVGGSVTIVYARRGVRRVTARTARVPVGVEQVPECDVLTAVAGAIESLRAGRRGAGVLSEHGLGAAPEILGRFEGPARATLLRVGSQAQPIGARLVLCPTPRACRLAWEVDLDVPEVPLHETIYVNAAGRDRGAILSRQDRAPRAARALVYATSRDEGERDWLPFPPASEWFGAGLRDWGADFQPSWVRDQITDGNNVSAFSTGPVAGLRREDESVDFAPDDPVGRDQAVLNLFALCNQLHDLFWRLGFREPEGSFQKLNSGSDGVGSDPVRARVLVQEVEGGASMSRARDGSPAFLVTGTDPSGGRFAALDADVVFHEYTHGVTHRMVASRFISGVLTDPQPLGMSEGWSDYFALSFLNARRPADRTILGTYFAGPGGLRGAPYDDAFNAYATYGQLGQAGHAEPHEAGEIWCAVLASMERRVGRAGIARERAGAICRQVVFDSLRFVPAEPTFLDGRTAMLDAIGVSLKEKWIQATEADAVRAALWAAFAWLGMGRDAKSPETDYTGIVEDFTPGP